MDESEAVGAAQDVRIVQVLLPWNEGVQSVTRIDTRYKLVQFRAIEKAEGKEYEQERGR